MNLSSFKNFTDSLKEQEQLMPVLFIGHGSPMNGIENTHFSRNWAQMAKKIPIPEHYLTLLYTLGLKTSKDAVSFFNATDR